MKVAVGVLLLVCLAQLASASMPVLSGKSSLRFGEITAENIADNSISTSKLQAYSVGAAQLAGGAVDANKIAGEAIYAPHFSPNSVTSRSLAIDTVTIHIDGQDPIESPAMQAGRTIPVGPTSVQPFEGIAGAVVIDSPDVADAYIVEGKARGPGVILGWYPAKNGHLLRYQHARSLRGLVCADVGFEDMDITYPCACSCDSNDIFDFGGGVADCSCSCTVTKNFQNANWDRDLGNSAGANSCDTVCTSLAETDFLQGGQCTDPNGGLLSDPACLTQANPSNTLITDGTGVDLDVDVQPDGNTNQINQPEACSAYTSVEDVLNPQEGISNYAPSVESIEIDQTGRVFLTFFGYGENDRLNGITHPDIDIVVVVLLDEQFGA